MRISNKLLIGLFIIVLIALNFYVIPQQKKVQLELDNKVVWEIPTSINVPLDYTLLSSNSLIQSVSTGLHFQLQSFDLKTGKQMHSKVFLKEVGSASNVICIEDALYVIFATSGIYKLDATTLEVIWRIDWKVEIYNWAKINVEQSKDLILVSYFNHYWNFYTFIKQNTGEIYYQKMIDKTVIIENDITDIFSPLKHSNWGAYYNYKNSNFVLDTTNKDILSIGDNYLMDISDQLKLTSFAYGPNSRKYTYQRSNLGMPFLSRTKALFLESEITASYKKEITTIQANARSSIFCFEYKEKYASSNNTNLVDYVFLKKDAPHANLSIHNIAASPQAYVSTNYFVALQPKHQSQSHQEVLILDLNTLSLKQSFYLPLKQDLLKLFCDQNQVYALVRKADGKTYWLAVSIAL
ncbi:MAG: hypothetical protein JKY03_14650 [Aureispira sp.]|nr:hypothetical protein [Aureispira sp.]